MPDLLLRALALALVCAALALVVWGGRHIVDTRRRRALAVSAPAEALSTRGSEASHKAVRILVFSSEDCSQCHVLQAPAIARVLAARGEQADALDVDTPSSPELARHYGILTLPSTIVLDANGRAHAANFGFASSEKLIAQVDAILAASADVSPQYHTIGSG